MTIYIVGSSIFTNKVLKGVELGQITPFEALKKNQNDHFDGTKRELSNDVHLMECTQTKTEKHKVKKKRASYQFADDDFIPNDISDISSDEFDHWDSISSKKLNKKDKKLSPFIQKLRCVKDDGDFNTFRERMR